MSKLPKIYHEDINKSIKNNKQVTYIRNSNSISESNNESDSIEEVLNKVFNGVGYSFNIPLRIETYHKVYNTSLIGKTSNYLLTFDNDTIPISDIKKIVIL